MIKRHTVLLRLGVLMYIVISLAHTSKTELDRARGMNKHDKGGKVRF